eukprot:jgi/Pico_ML_1/54674/g52.t1
MNSIPQRKTVRAAYIHFFLSCFALFASDFSWDGSLPTPSSCSSSSSAAGGSDFLSTSNTRMVTKIKFTA